MVLLSTNTDQLPNLPGYDVIRLIGSLPWSKHGSFGPLVIPYEGFQESCDTNPKNGVPVLPVPSLAWLIPETV